MLDQFFTQPQTAIDCVKFFNQRTENLFDSPIRFIEPSAGAGDFVLRLPKNTIAMDIEPQIEGIKKRDFFNYERPKEKREDVVVIGNPPFGKRGKMALEFIKHASTFADTIAFIVPMCFTKYGIHRHIPIGYKLIGEKFLDKNSFYTLDKNSFTILSSKNYQVGSVFQIWTNITTGLCDRRIYNPPPIKHDDFDMYQYNNTRKAECYFDFDFDFAVPCQGYQNYNRREHNPDNCERNKQWMLFANIKQPAKKILQKIDFHNLAHRRATTTPGFRKHDVITEYNLCL